MFQFNIIKFLQKLNRQKFEYVILGRSASEEIEISNQQYWTFNGHVTFKILYGQLQEIVFEYHIECLSILITSVPVGEKCVNAAIL